MKNPVGWIYRAVSRRSLCRDAAEPEGTLATKKLTGSFARVSLLASAAIAAADCGKWKNVREGPMIFDYFATPSPQLCGANDRLYARYEIRDCSFCKSSIPSLEGYLGGGIKLFIPRFDTAIITAENINCLLARLFRRRKVSRRIEISRDFGKATLVTSKLV